MGIVLKGIGAGTVLALGALLVMGSTFSSSRSEKKSRSVLDFTMKNIDGKEVPLSRYRGKVILIVNVASKCGYTPQYKGLEELYNKFKDKGFVILGFPANNFGQQEPGTDSEIKNFCESNYGVTFDMFSKISVKGEDEHPLYTFLTSEKTDPKFAGDVKWNFQKYLVNRKGLIVAKFLSAVDPMAPEVTSAIEEALK